MQSRAATVHRLLQSERRKQQLRQRAHSKPGTLLKHQIPIRTFAEWNEAEPGFAEIEERFGIRVKKSYHAPQTPYQRVLACAEVSVADKKELQRQYRLLNPAALKRELDKQRKELFRLAAKKRPLKLKRHANQRGIEIKPLLSI